MGKFDNQQFHIESAYDTLIGLTVSSLYAAFSKNELEYDDINEPEGHTFLSTFSELLSKINDKDLDLKNESEQEKQEDRPNLSLAYNHLSLLKNLSEGKLIGETKLPTASPFGKAEGIDLSKVYPKSEEAKFGVLDVAGVSGYVNSRLSQTLEDCKHLNDSNKLVSNAMKVAKGDDITPFVFTPFVVRQNSVTSVTSSNGGGELSNSNDINNSPTIGRLQNTSNTITQAANKNDNFSDSQPVVGPFTYKAVNDSKQKDKENSKNGEDKKTSGVKNFRSLVSRAAGALHLK